MTNAQVNLNDPDLLQQLTEVAQRNDRSVAAEARIAVRRHIQNEQALSQEDLAWLKETGWLKETR